MNITINGINLPCKVISSTIIFDVLYLEVATLSGDVLLVHHSRVRRD